MFTLCCPKAGPTGGAGVAFPQEFEVLYSDYFLCHIFHLPILMIINLSALTKRDLLFAFANL